jgi:hypothetical protein
MEFVVCLLLVPGIEPGPPNLYIMMVKKTYFRNTCNNRPTLNTTSVVTISGVRMTTRLANMYYET